MPQASLKLEIQDGPSGGREFELTQQDIIIGRDSAVDLVIPAQSVSRKHARISWQDGEYFIQDLGSSNGTFLNGNPLSSTPNPIQAGDQIRLGQEVSLVVIGTIHLDNMAQTRISSSGLSQVAETLLNMPSPEESLQRPPTLQVEVAGEATRNYSLVKDVMTIGRSDDNDIVISSKLVSRYHARLEQSDQGYRFVVLPQVTNPVLHRGRPLDTEIELHHNDILRIGSNDPGMMVTMEYHTSSETDSTLETRKINFGDDNRLQFGRDPSNDVVLNAPNVSRFHAQVEKVGQRYRVRDLNSSNGTFVNGQPIEGEAWLEPHDSVKIGSYRFILGFDQFTQIDDTMGLQVTAVGLNKWVRKDLNILKDISLTFQPREFVVVVGQSGGGKSTLIDAIAGNRPATHGKVMVNDIDLYRNYDALRNDIGYVPQKDIIHMELTVYQALDYAAQLRMPSDTTKEERHQRIMEVLADLDLTHRKDVQISGLSGGQQKRVSIGVELLTSPGLFFLDEPTSGLDPGTETSFMQLMRRLADQGRTIILVTHATKNVMLADKVVFLARGGYLTWFGPPNEALEYFDQFRSERDRKTERMEFDKIYTILDDPTKGNGEDWAKRFAAHPAFQKYIVQPLQQNNMASTMAAPARAVQQPTPSKRSKQVSGLRQFFILSARNIKILTRDRSSLILMLLAAPLVGSLDFILGSLMGRDIFDYFTGDMSTISVTLFLLTIYTMLVGGLSQMREFVKESDIYQRERLVNLKILPYVASKLWVAALLALYHGICYAVIHYLAFDMPGGSLEFFMSYITLFLGTLAGMMLGLLASAIAPQASSAPMIMILLLVPQIVLSGALAPVPLVASAPISTHWTFDAMLNISGGGADVAADACWDLDKEIRDTLTLEDKENLGCRCMGPNIFNPVLCNFPGIGKYYNPAVDQEEPIEPISPGDPPPEPQFPDPPEAPADQTESIAMAEYFTSLQQYQDETDLIRQDYEVEITEYQAKTEVYKAEVAEYQTALTEWQIDRNAAIGGAEGLISSFIDDQEMSFISKDDRGKFIRDIGITWIAQAAIIVVMSGIILILIKRKDVN